MSQKGRAQAQEDELAPIAGGVLEGVLLVGAFLTVALVGLWFKLDVNRVFDVPKALALKVGGCGIFLVWLLYGLFGAGFPWRSIRLFLAPVVALLLSVAISTALSIDPAMSFYGVYERQFGFQGLLGCVGLFVVTATCFRSRRGAIAGFAGLAVVGGVIGSYGWLQSRGLDPYGFFKGPHDKVYSTLGNATFAGNALALIFPVSLLVATVLAAAALKPSRRPGKAQSEARQGPLVGPIAYGVGFLAMLGLQILPAAWATGHAGFGQEVAQTIFKAGVAVSVLFLLGLAASGSMGPAWSRLESKAARFVVDAMATGALGSMVLAIAAGLVVTRTRGAWVGTVVAIAGGLILLPKLFADDAALARRMRTAGWLALVGSAVLLGGLLLAFPNHLYSRTVFSIPYAFNPEHVTYGQGQGTRRYLWSESPRVLLHHSDTLARQHRDLEDYAAKVPTDGEEDILARSPGTKPLDQDERRFSVTWRSVSAWFFGIGIETYRYAFMSHKSKKLEALDPMTNHDNPHNNYLYVLASFGVVGLAAYLWLLFRLISVAYCGFAAQSADCTRGERAIAFGVVTSFFSYAVYSIAGFDSVACSVFFYFLLGCAAAFFEPTGDDPPRAILVNVRRQWARFRGRDERDLSTAIPKLASAVTASVMGFLLVASMIAALSVHAAEQAFVGKRSRTFSDKIENIKAAIRKHPYESFYRQSLGTTYADAARQLRQETTRLSREGNTGEIQSYLAQAESYSRKGEIALYSALDHAWAPENIFISLFQLYYTSRKLPEAEQALERALEHSPHLGAVRANLAVLKLERGGYEAALKDCLWVIDVDAQSTVALRTCGRALHQLGKYKEASEYLARAVSIAPQDSVASAYFVELKRAMTATGGAPSG